MGLGRRGARRSGGEGRPFAGGGRSPPIDARARAAASGGIREGEARCAREERAYVGRDRSRVSQQSPGRKSLWWSPPLDLETLSRYLSASRVSDVLDYNEKSI